MRSLLDPFFQRIERAIEPVDGITRVFEYGYDPAGRLRTVQRNGTLVVLYTYDANGNRMRAEGEQPSADATYDDQDRLLTYGPSSYTYGPNGELASRTRFGHTTEYEYDSLGNLVRVLLPDGRVIRYAIDGRGRRVAKYVDDVQVRGWLYADQLRPIAELDGTGAVVSRFVYGSRANVPDSFIRGGQTYRLFADHLGSPRVILNASTGEIVQRMDFTAFGERLQDSNPGFQPFGFAGGLYDPDTGLVRFGARDYDPESGRWTAKDPIGFDGGDLNVYGYVLADPINLVDPNGLEWIDTALESAANFSAGFGDELTSGFGLADLAGLPSLTEAARGLFPGGDPVNTCSLGYGLGGYAADALGVAVGANRGFRPGGFLNNNRYLRVGWGRKGGDRVFRAAGDVVRRLTGQPHMDIFRRGPL